jgi:hypothetical protein
MRAATALLVQAGSRGILVDQHAQRLARESMFLLVFGSRPPIKAELLTRLTSGPPVRRSRAADRRPPPA